MVARRALFSTVSLLLACLPLGTAAAQTCPQVLDFDTDGDGLAIQAGQDLQYAYSSVGVEIVTCSCSGLGIAFDSSNPTGGDDDLGSPNATFGGPGIGTGGAAGMPGENAQVLGNLLIAAENEVDANGDGLIDVPDDDAYGAGFEFLFDEPSCVFSLELVDIEASEGPPDIIAYDAAGVVLGSFQGQTLGDNSWQSVDLGGLCGVSTLAVNIWGSGAIDNVVACVGGEEEVCDGVDNDGDGDIDEGFPDADGDGFVECADCDDNDATVYPGAAELCDGVDNDCDGSLSSDEIDGDGDGWTPCDGDCDDSDATVYPGAAELCDDIDNDCDGSLSDDEIDGDGDGWTPCDGDCDDDDPVLNPGAPEECDGEDDDCDGFIDEDFWDNDGIADCVDECPMVIDFDSDPFGNPIINGSEVSLEYWNWGVGSIQTFTDPTMSVADPSVAWDSSYPFAGFEDLGTPNEYFGGPGIGDGGWYGEPGENPVPLHNNLQAQQGNTWYVVNFNTSACVHSIDLIDVDFDEAPAQVILFDVNVQTIATYTATGLGDNSLETLDLGGTCGVYVMMIDFYGTGAWDNLVVCVDSDASEEVCDDEDNDGDGVVDEGCEEPGDDDDDECDDDDDGDDDDDDGDDDDSDDCEQENGDDDDDGETSAEPECGCSSLPSTDRTGAAALLGLLGLLLLGLRQRRP